MTVDNQGNALTYNGSTWATNFIDPIRNSIDSVSCTSSSFCMAVDGAGNALRHTTVTPGSSPDNIDNNYISSVSCTSNSFCVAVDDYGNAFIYNGSELVCFR